MKLWAVLVFACFFGIAFSQQAFLPLDGANIRVDSNIPNAAVGIGFDEAIPKGAVFVRVLSDQTVSITLDNGTIKIRAEEQSEDTSRGQMLSPSWLVSLVAGALLIGWSQRKVGLFVLIVSCSVYVSSSSIYEPEISIIFNPAEDLRELSIYSEGSILVTSEVSAKVDVKCAAEGSSRLGNCDQIFCFADDSNCFKDFDPARTIGVLLPESGDFPLLGEVGLAAIDMAIDDFGFLFPGIRIVSVDTEGNADIARQKVQSLYDKGVRVFFGPTLPDELLSLLEWSKNMPEEDTVFISPLGSFSQMATFPGFFSMSPSNRDQAQALCGYISQQNVTDLYVINQDTIDGNDKLAGIQEACQEFSVNVNNVTSFEPGQIRSREDTLSILDLLESELQEGNAVNEAILVISVGEIRYFLEGASNNNKLLSRIWMGTDIAMNEDIFDSPDALRAARIVSLRSMGYLGNHVEAEGRRAEFFQTLQEKTGNSPLIAALAYDSILLLFSTMAHRQTSSTVISGAVVFESRYTYGLSGRLRISNNLTWRADGEYAIFSVGDDTLDQTWLFEQTINLRVPDQAESGYSLSYRAAGVSVITPDDFQDDGCESVDVFFYSPAHILFHQNITRERVEDEERIIVPAYYNFTLSFNCGFQSVIKACSGTAEGLAVACNNFEPLETDSVVAKDERLEGCVRWAPFDGNRMLGGWFWWPWPYCTKWKWVDESPTSGGNPIIRYTYA